MNGGEPMVRITLKADIGERSFTERTEIGKHGKHSDQITIESADPKHAVLEPTNAGWQLVDLGSSTGTFINGNRIIQETLSERDEIRIGEAKLVVTKIQVPPFSRAAKQALASWDKEEKMSDQVSIGDVVVLNSGGPLMTVASNPTRQQVHCCWFTADGNLCTENFPVAMLTVKPKKRKCECHGRCQDRKRG